MANQFFWIFFGTIAVVRIFLWIDPTPAPTIPKLKWHHHVYHKFRTHHWMLGLISIVVAFAIHSLILYAIGLGLFVDELTYLLIGGKTHKDNYSVVSLSGTVIFMILTYFFRQAIITHFFVFNPFTTTAT